MAIHVPRLSQVVILNGKIYQAGLINDIDGVEISCLLGLWQIDIRGNSICQSISSLVRASKLNINPLMKVA